MIDGGAEGAAGAALPARELQRGLRAVTRDGVFSQVMTSLTTGVVLVGFAMQLGASDFMIGLLAAIPFIGQLAQLPAIALVERARLRRDVVVGAALLGRAFLLPMALLPALPGPELRLAILFLAALVNAVCGAVAACAWNSWMRDLVPEERLGLFFSRRLTLATAAGLIAGLGAGLLISAFGRLFPAHTSYAYGVLFVLGAAAGALSVLELARTPEPARGRAAAEVLKRLAAPFHDRPFRRLVVFLSSWSFAANLAAPFFAVAMLRGLGLGMGVVTALTVLSQLANVAALPVWGRVADRFGNRTVLALCAPVFLAAVALWVFVDTPAPLTLLAALLVFLHVVLGVATAGVTLASSNVALKLAPRGAATAYLAANAIANAVAAAAATAIGGLLAEFFAAAHLSVALRWGEAAGEWPLFELRRLDFVFIAAFACGIVAIWLLGRVREQGEVDERAALQHILEEARASGRALTSVAGLRGIAALPVGIIRRGG